MSRATTSYPKMLKHIAVCISKYHILCGMHILLICLVQAVDEIHLCVQMWTHVFKIFFFFFSWKGGNMEKQLQGFVWAISCFRLSLDINNRLATNILLYLSAIDRGVVLFCLFITRTTLLGIPLCLSYKPLNSIKHGHE